MKTLGNEFGDYHCDKSDLIESAKGSYFLGGIIGVIISSILADNIGRRPNLLINLLLGVIGHGMVLVASDLAMV